MSRDGLTVFEDLERIGDHAAILRAVSAAQADGRLTDWQALSGGRAGLRSGAYGEAGRWLALAAASDDPAIATVARLEQAQWSIAARLDLAPAKALFRAEAGSRADLPPVIRAEADWLESRMVGALRVYREVPAGRAEQALKASLDAAGRLEEAGLMRRSLAARLHVAERQDGLDRDRVLEAVAERAEAALQPDYAAACHRAAAYACLGEDRYAAADRFGELADSAYRRAGAVFGDLEVEALRQTAALARGAGPFEPLEACAEAFCARGHLVGALSCLLTLSSASLRRGDTVHSVRHRARLVEIAALAGAGGILVQDGLSKAEIAMRANRYRETTSYIDEVLAQALPAMLRAGALVQRSVALSQLGRSEDAAADMTGALALYATLDSEADASDLIAKAALDRVGEGTEEGFLAAEDLLVTWQGKDLARGDALRAAAKLEGRIDIRVNRMLILKRQEKDVGPLLAEARTLIGEARQALAAVPEERVDAKAQSASLHQRDGTIANLEDDMQGVIDAYAKAASLYQEIGYGFQAANCYYLLGTLFFNLFNAAERRDAADHFGHAEGCLQAALRYYRDEGGMQALAAQAAEKLARLYLAAHGWFEGANRTAILAEADRLILDGLDGLDDIRRAYSAADRLDARQGKAAHGKEAEALHDLALRLRLLIEPDARKALHVVSRQKSRILADLMGADLGVPGTLCDALARVPGLAALLRDERASVEALAAAKGDAIGATRARVATLYDRMAEHPAARPYVEVRRGEAPDAEDLPAILAEPGTQTAFVDWVDVAGRIWLLVSKTDGSVEPAPTGLTADQVRAFRNANLTRSGFRLTLNEMPAMLAVLDPLVAPLAALTAPGDHLVLCPTGPVGAVPVHALTLDGGALLDRNPIFFAPSLGVLRGCRLFESAAAARGTALFGVLDDAHAASAEMIDRLSAAIGEEAILGPRVTAAAIAAALASAQAIHFQGHGEHDAVQPLRSCLRLPGEARLTAAEIFNLRRVSARLVVLGACEGAVSRAESGDELLGLIPAFLAAGVGTVVAAGWRVMEPTAARFMEVFYDALRHRERRPIEAVREAALDLKGRPGTDTPYHWAAFVGHGDPWRRPTS